MLFLTRLALERPKRWLAGLAAATAALGTSAALRLDIRTDAESLYPGQNPVIVQSRTDRAVFEDTAEAVLLVVSRAGGPLVESPEGFRFLKKAHLELEGLPGVRRNGVLSIVSLPEKISEKVALQLVSFFAEIPEDGAAFTSLVAQLRSFPLASGLLLAENGRAAAFSISSAPDRPRRLLVDELEHWKDAQEGAPFELLLSGPLLAETKLGDKVLQDLGRLVPWMIALVAVLLFLFLRSAQGVFLPLLAALGVLTWTFGLMAALGIPVTLVTTVLPVLLLATSITDVVHFLERFQARAARLPRHETLDWRGPALKAALLEAVREIQRPMLVTSLTTAAAFLSFLSADLAPLRHFGVFAALGILIALFFSFTLVPACALLLVRAAPALPPRHRRAALVLLLERGAVRHPKALCCGAALALLAALPGLQRLQIQDSWLDNFAADSPLRRAEKLLNEFFWGSYRHDVVFQGPPEFFRTAQGVAFMENFSRYAAEGPHVGGVATYLAPVTGVMRVLKVERPLASLDTEHVDQVTKVAEWFREQIFTRRFLDASGSIARARIVANDPDFQRSVALAEYLEEGLPALLPRPDLAWHFSGDLPQSVAVVRAIVGNQVKSSAWTLLGVGVLLVAFLRSLALALIAILPALGSSLLILAGMGHLGVPLGVASSTFTALTVGVGVDFAVYFLCDYRTRRRRGLDPAAALAGTPGNGGKALRWNALVLGLGFLLLGLSDLKPNRTLGVLLSASILSCYGLTLAWLPQLLALRSRARSASLTAARSAATPARA